MKDARYLILDPSEGLSKKGVETPMRGPMEQSRKMSDHVIIEFGLINMSWT